MDEDGKRLLIYGAGVIGCLYGALFDKAGYDVTIYARGKRLESLSKYGLNYKTQGEIQQAGCKIVSEVSESYDFVFLAVRENQLHTALMELKENPSPTIVTMVNSLENYEKWEEICGKGRILPAFPGAGGGFEGEVLNAGLTPWIVQPTTFGEIDRSKTKRLKTLAAIFKHSHIPYQIVHDMHQWQLCHLALVVPIADAYYAADAPEKAGDEWPVMEATALQLKKNFIALKKAKIKLSPAKMNLFCWAPKGILKVGLHLVFNSQFGDRFMYRHAMKAPDEMRQLHDQFYGYMAEYF